MRRRWLSSLLVLLITILPATAQNFDGLPESQVVAFESVNVLPMDQERILENQTVLVRGERIIAVGSASDVDVPEEALRVDGTGRYLIPGWAEMHGHVPSPTSQPEFTENVLFLFVANGVTTVRGMLGQEGQLALRERANNGEILSPSLYLAGPPFTGGSVSSPAAARQMVRQQQKAGWDYLKVLEGMSQAEYDAMAETAKAVDIPFIGHVPNGIDILHVIESGQQSIDHLDGYIEHLDGAEGPVDEAELEALVNRAREAGVWNVPTMALWETLQGTASLQSLTSQPELTYMPPETVEEWTNQHRNRRQSSDFDEARAQRVIDNRMRILEALNERGARIVFGTDAPQQFSVPGFSIHREVVRMRDAGMTPYQILESATSNVGEYFSDKDDFGTIAEGQRADLILLEANPLDDITRISDRAGVMVRGQWLPEANIQERLQAIAASYD